jgi:hypothetical protein
MPIKLSKRTEGEIAEPMREGDVRKVDEVIHEGMTLLRARQEFREPVFNGAAEADRGELLDGDGVFKEIKARLRPAKCQRRV